MSAIAIIPARSGSKGIRRKNLRMVGTETLLQQAIRKAKSACHETIVSSDCDEILQHAVEHGAVPLKRPLELSRDDSSSESAIVHAVVELGIRERIVMIQCTAPFMTVNDIVNCSRPTSADLSLCCHPFHGFVLDVDGQCINRTGTPRRQDMQPQWLVSGSCYSFMPDYLNLPWYSGSIRIVPSEGRYLEIDSTADLKAAQANYDYPLTEEWLEKLN